MPQSDRITSLIFIDSCLVNAKNKNNVSLSKVTEAKRHIYAVSMPLITMNPVTKHNNAAFLRTPRSPIR